jgi:serpin B
MFFKMSRTFISFLLCLVIILTAIGCEEALEPIDLSVDESLAKANRSFSFDILRVLNEEEGEHNLFYSPLSISMAISMALNGAKGETRVEMLQSLSYQGLDMGMINASYAEYQRYLDQNLGTTELYLKNSIWIRTGETLNQEFLDIISNDYLAQSEYLDFSDPGAAEVINGWIEEATKGKIKDMLTPPLPADAVLYLINAIYFKGDWAQQFDEDQTFDADFHNQDGSVSKVEMMNDKRTVWYMNDENLQAVRLPYEDENSSMIIMLPGDNQDIENLIEDLDEEMFKSIHEGFWEAEDLILQIPKFKMEYGTKNLNQALKNLGMETVFTGDADLSGIRDGLFISRVLHKAFIEVNEKGSEAAAATVVEVLESAAPEDPLTFRADHPFLFLIYDEEAESILFIGKYSE